MFQSPHSETEYQASVADAIKRSVALGDLEGVVITQYQHLRRQEDPRRACGQVAQRGERIPIGSAAFGGNFFGNRHVFTAGQMMETESIRRGSHCGDLADVSTRLPLRTRARVLNQDRRDDSQVHRAFIALPPTRRRVNYR